MPRLGGSPNGLFRASGWVAIFLVATFLGKDFVVNVVNALNQLAPVN